MLLQVSAIMWEVGERSWEFQLELVVVGLTGGHSTAYRLQRKMEVLEGVVAFVFGVG